MVHMKYKSELSAFTDRVREPRKNSCFTWCVGHPISEQLNGAQQTKWCKLGTGTRLVKGTRSDNASKMPEGFLCVGTSCY